MGEEEVNGNEMVESWMFVSLLCGGGVRSDQVLLGKVKSNDKDVMSLQISAVGGGDDV